MSSFETRREIVHGDGAGDSLKVFLMSRLQPWRWQIMLANRGIQVERGAQPVPDVTLDYQLSAGDVVVIDDAYGVTWMALRKWASVAFRDLVFCPQRADNGFLNNEVKALVADGTAIDVPPTEVPYLTALIPKLTPLGTFPIRHLILVSHASPFGNIELPMKGLKPNPDEPTADHLNWETLTAAIAEGSLRIDGKGRNPVVFPRPENGQGKPVPCAVIIRGCSSGVHTILLEKIREAFGPQVDTVVMPKHFDAVGFLTGGGAPPNPALVEYFTHRFIVTSKTPLDRQGVVDAFKGAGLTDWLGNPVPDSDWNDLIPKDVSRSASTKRLMMSIDGRSRPGEFRAAFETKPLATDVVKMAQKDEPTPAQVKEFEVKRWQRLPAFNDSEWPFWKRMGWEIASKEDFIAFWTYQVNPAANKQVMSREGQWQVRAMRYSYEIRTPLVDNGTLICKYLPNGEPGTASNNIDYNDIRIFGRSKHIPPHFAQTL